jgi:Uma2 family endonuclease
MKTILPYRFDVPTFDALCAAGTFGDQKVELLNGLLVMMTSGPAHDNAVTALGDRLEELLSRNDWTVREEKPVVLSRRWKPLPDLVVVRGRRTRYAQRTPGRLDIALVVEVSDKTYPKDAGPKRRSYARHGIPAYWIVDVNRRVVEVYTLGAEGLMLNTSFTEHQDVPLILDGTDFGTVAAADLFP